MNDEEYNNLIDLIVRGLYPQGMDKIRKDGLRRKSKRFLVKDGLLFYYDKKRNTGLLVVLTSQKTMILEGCHSAILGGGHFGRDKTLEKLSERYYWKGMVDDVKNFCKYFDKCQRANRFIH